MQGLPFLQVKIGSRRHQADPMPPVFVAGGQPGPEFPLSEIWPFRDRTGLSARAAAGQNGGGKQDDVTVDPIQN